MKIPTRTTTVLALTIALSLSACGKKEEPIRDVVDDNMVTEVPVDDAMPLNSVDAAPAPTPTLNVTNSVAPPPAFTDSQQMRDDADATGLTSRLPTDEPAVANETQPVR